ncbi:hypothetical protein ZWY2020_002632 [Hordeum vulgare]|nr:hypothetical protein ZWY2020_002632 [Hordeum vulgare]
MDYSLAALKLFASQLAGSTTAPSSEGSSMAQMLFGTAFAKHTIFLDAVSSLFSLESSPCAKHVKHIPVCLYFNL